MIIHTRKTKHFDQGHIVTAKNKSKSVKASTADRRNFLDKIRSKEAKNHEQALLRIPFNKISDFFGVAGVYFLINENRVVYVGETACIMSRLFQHKQDKEFDGFRFIRLEDATERLRLEKAYIQKYAPKHNITHNPNITVPKPIVRFREDLSKC